MSITNQIKHEIKIFWNQHGVLPSRCFAGKNICIQLRIESDEIKPIEISGVVVFESGYLESNQAILICNEEEFRL